MRLRCAPPTAGHCCPRAVAPAGWRRRLARPPGPQAITAVGGRWVAGRHPCGCRVAGGCPCGRLPIQATAPYREPWHQLAATTRGLAMANHPCKWPGHVPVPLSSLPSLRKCSKNK
ncbi:hypothetical protein BHE74_00051982 [Ensete ventricosum]|nr:hypothetical protein BHE74_00051982 [Ensete ventricosum]